ncbi:MAG: putative Ig domain-containing protein [Acidimicrobiales bacterium]
MPAGQTLLSSVSCITASSCSAVGGTSILVTADGGVDWSSQTTPSGVGSLFGVFCAGPANCEAVGVGRDFGGTIETLSAPPSITTTNLNTGTIGVPYASALAASGGLAPYSWAVSGGTLPPGLHLAPDGTLSGVPIISGEYTATFTVTDANNLSSDAALVISIKPLAAPGYWLVASDGGIFSYGGAQFYGSTGSLHLNAPIISMAATPDDAGYWLLASDGGIFAFGDAVFYGSTGGMHLNAPIVAMAPTPDGGGYWLVASDGGVFAFGDADFYGSTGSITLDRPIVGMASTIDGLGYWLVASDGGIFTYGDAGFFGSTGGLPLHQPIVAMTTAPDGGGYWLVASDGGIFSFGEVNYFGSAGGLALSAPIVGMDRTADGQGYWMVARDGGIFDYGDAGFYGSAGGLRLNRPVVGMAAIQSLSPGTPSFQPLSPSPTSTPGSQSTIPQFLQQPTDQNTEPGGSATFAIGIAGDPAPTVQWQVSKDNGSTFSNIPGATSQALSVEPVGPTQLSYRYRAVISNLAGSDTSASARVVLGA